MTENEIQKIKLFKEFHPGHERKHPINAIAVHGSAGGHNAQALFDWWRSLPNLTDEWSKKKYKKMKGGIGFYHFIIDIDGTIYNTFDLDRWFYHSHSGFADSRSIGVCIVNQGKKNSHVYNFDQYFALNELIAYLMVEHEYIESLDSHDYRAMRYSVVETPTPCPGPHFDWNELWDTRLDINK